MRLGHINAGKKYPMVMPDGTEIKQAIHLKILLTIQELK